MANGKPISAVIGREEIFEAAKHLWISSTFGGETLSLSASIATIAELEKGDHFTKTKKLGKLLYEGWKDLLIEFPNISAQAHSDLPDFCEQ